MLSKKVPLYFSVLSILIGAALVFIVFVSFSKSDKQKKSSLSASVIEQSTACDFNVIRLNGYHYIKPLLYTDPDCESPVLTPLKTDIENLVKSLKSSGSISTASVYLRVFKKGTWMCYNPEEKYNPGSLIKLPILLTFLWKTEENPQLINKKLFFEKHDSNLPKQPIASETLKQGNYYTMKELMRYMIVYGDNDATKLLETEISNKELEKTFSNLGIGFPKQNEKGAYLMSAKDYSIFLKVLYNGSYLNMQNSEYATSLLAESVYNDALVKGLPDKTEIAHNSGEVSNVKEHQLHDAGIIFLNDTPYIITIMTKGRDLKKMSDAIVEISKLVYNNITSNKS